MDDIILHIDQVGHWFGDNKVLHQVELKVGRGQICAVVGPSGCGKSTLLRAIVGTHPSLAGKVVVTGAAGGDMIVSAPGRDRGIVYQRYSLYPFLTAQENVAIGPILDRTSFAFRIFKHLEYRKLRAKLMDEAAELLERVSLGEAAERYPSELSGGMRQRVAIAQALIMKPEILLLDEPFGALDEATREDLQHLLLGLAAENRAAREAGEPPRHTIFIVTHELNEALYVGDRVLGLSQHWDWKAAGHTSSPGATIIYDKPAPVFRAGGERDMQSLRAQRQEIREVVFEPETPQLPGEHLTFWESKRGQEAKAP